MKSGMCNIEKKKKKLFDGENEEEMLSMSVMK